MLKTLTHDVTEDPESVIVYNMHESDVYHSKDLFMISCMGWLELDKSRTLLDLENFLRDNDYNSYLIAYDFEETENVTLKSVNDHDMELLYECSFCCMHKDLSLEKLLSKHDSYENNYEKLKKSGVLQVTNADAENNELSDLNRGIKNGTKKLEFVKYSPLESISEVSKLIKKETGKKPLIRVVGTAGNALQLYSFVDDNGNLQCEIGWVIHERGDEKIYELLNLQQ